jgi:signal transduction histidine kinase
VVILNRILKSSFKAKIIITFCSVMLIFIIIVARVSYQFIRNLYLDQLSDQVNTVTWMISKQIDGKYIKALEVGVPSPIIKNYFLNVFNQHIKNEEQKEIFIFSYNFHIIMHSDSSVLLGKPHPQLILNRKEIYDLQSGETTTSLPFKGRDNKWYLWGFHRLDINFWLAYQEGAQRLQKVEEFSRIFWYLGFSGMVFTFLLGWIIARAITRPIDKLVKFSSEIGKGNFSVSLPGGIKGEIKTLSDALDKMRRDLIIKQKEKEEILAQIAHEIRNPLGGIELLTNLIKEDIQPKNKNIEYLNKILNEISGLKALITAYLNYSRPLAAKPEWNNLSGMIDEIEKILEKEMKAKKIRLKKDIQIDTIRFDPVHLKQILLNLINNSIEANVNSGMIKIKAVRNGKFCHLSVMDNGPGIQNKNIPIIFEPFYTTKSDGTGLGLAISKKLCQENSAMLTVQNNKHKGCVFTIIIPLD